MKQNSWYAGVDVGGTATKCWLYRQGTGLVASGTGPQGNYVAVGASGVVQAVEASLYDAVQKGALSRVPSIQTLTVGVAGVRRLSDRETVKKALEERLHCVGSTDVVSDGVVGLIAGTLGEPGVVVIAGTGSTVWSLSGEGVWQRAGGWGYLLGDEGGGFFLGLHALRAVVQATDGLGPWTRLVNEIADGWNVSHTSEFISIVYERPLPRARIAALAPVVLRLANEGDLVAGKLRREAVRSLSQLAVTGAAMAALDGPVPVVAAGGLFHDKALYETFAQDVRRRSSAPIVVSRLRTDPAVGACVASLQKAEVWTPREKDILIKSFSYHETQITTE